MATPLRRAVDVAAVLTAIAALVVVAVYGYRHFEKERRIDALTGSLRDFHTVIAVQAAAGQGERTQQGWPLTVHPSWFKSPPRNTLLSADRPWVEVAAPAEADLMDPPVRIAALPDFAGFWYNPYKGVVRARVPLLISERETVALYNRVNRTFITECVVPFLPENSARSETAQTAEAAEEPEETQNKEPERAEPRLRISEVQDAPKQ